jgi:hypothetical protein
MPLSAELEQDIPVGFEVNKNGLLSAKIVLTFLCCYQSRLLKMTTSKLLASSGLQKILLSANKRKSN